MKIGIASDHAGYLKKVKIIKYLSKKYEVMDYGTYNKDSVDYPDYAKKVCHALNNNEIELGILICYTGIGMSIAANKIKGIRCAKVDNTKEAILTREHNNANVIALSARKSTLELKDIIDKFLTTKFSNEERHLRRINKLEDYDVNEIELPIVSEGNNG